MKKLNAAEREDPDCGHFVAGVNQRGRAACCMCGMEYDHIADKFYKYDPEMDWKKELTFKPTQL